MDNAEGFNVEGRHLARQPHAAFHRMDVFRRDSGTPTAPEVRGIEFAKLSTGESPGPNLKPPQSCLTRRRQCEAGDEPFLPYLHVSVIAARPKRILLESRRLRRQKNPQSKLGQERWLIPFVRASPMPPT